MKNPCEDCIIKVNCTAVCPKKENYRHILEDAVRRFASTGRVSYRKQMQEYIQMLAHTEAEEVDIGFRRARYKIN